MPDSEAELKAFKENLIDEVVGTPIEIEGATWGDNHTGPVTKKGVEGFLDRLRSRGYKVTRG